MKYKVVLLGMVLGGLVVGCGSSSPKAFAKKSGKLNCQTLKKCDEALFNEAGYDSVADCVDDTVKDEDVEAFVDACEDFDSGKARQCLAAGRKYKRSCDDDDISEEDARTCAEVCGSINIPTGELILDPGNPEVTVRILERAVEIMEEEYEDEPADPQGSFSAP